jgi:hypothetical protein
MKVSKYTTCEKCSKIVRSVVLKQHRCDAVSQDKQNRTARKAFYAANPAQKINI